MAYNSSHTGAQIDSAVGTVIEKESTWDSKGAGDMLASVYDPNGKSQDVFQYADAKASAAKEYADTKAPAYTYSTADITAGSSALETGKLYFVYE